MKKSLLVVAAMFAAVCANAQQWNAVEAGTAVDTEVAAAGAETAVGTFNGINVYLCGATAWTVKNEGTSEWTGTDGKTYSNAYIQGNTNGMAGGLMHSSGVSSHIKIVATADGTVTVAAKYGKSKPIWAAEVASAEVEDVDVADMSAYLMADYSQVAAEGNILMYIKEDGTGVQNAEATADTYATLPISVKAGKTYFFWVSGSKIMVCGINFTTGASGISTVKAAAEAEGAIYNIAGQKVAADYKGLVIKNGKKFIQK